MFSANLVGVIHGDVDRVLISHEQIATRVRALAARITEDHAAEAELTIVPILTGAMIFCADLIRHLPMRMKIGLLTVSSYPGKSVQSQGSRLLAEQLGEVAGRDVLLVDDILDSGGTIRLVQEMLQRAGARSLKTCVLLRKDRPTARGVHVDYVGFDIPDEFVVGYGLDHNNYYRNLPEIVTLKEHLLKA